MSKNSKLSLFAIIPAFVLCFAARYFQIAYGTDFSTGCLYDDNGFALNFAFYALLIIALAAAIILGIVDKKRGSAFYRGGAVTDGRAVMVGFPLLIAGALAAYEGYVQTKALTPSGFLIFVDFLFGAAMLALAFVILYKKEITAALGFSFIIPAIYYTLRGIAVFNDRMVISSIPEYLIDCLTVIGMGVFFMLLAKLLSGNEGKNTRTALCAVGSTTAVLTLSNAAAVIVADVMHPSDIGTRIVSSAEEAERCKQALISGTLFSASDHGYFMSYTSWVDVVMAVMVILTIAAMFAKPRCNEAAEQTEISTDGEASTAEEISEEQNISVEQNVSVEQAEITTDSENNSAEQDNSTEQNNSEEQD